MVPSDEPHDVRSAASSWKWRIGAGLAGMGWVLLGWWVDRPAWAPGLRVAVLALPFVASALLLMARLRTRAPYPWLALLLGALTPWVALTVLWFLLAGGPMAFFERDFDAARWRAQAGSIERDNPRWPMRADVMRRLRSGMTHAHVETLLGRPDEIGRGEWLYNLGMWGAFRMDYYFLHVRFDDQERLRNAVVLQH